MAHGSTHDEKIVLAQLIARLNADLSPEAVLRVVCDEAALVLGVTGVVAGIYDEQRRVIRYTATYGDGGQALTDLIPPPDAPASRQPSEMCAELGPIGMVGLWHGDLPVGALAIKIPENHIGLSDSEANLLRALADLASQAMVNAIRLASARSRLDDLEAINTLSRALAETLDLERIYELLYDVALKLLPEVAGAIFTLFDAERQEMICAFAILDGERLDPSEFPPLPLAPLGVGYQSNVIHTRQPVIIGGLEESSQVSTVFYVGDSGAITESVLFVPMLARERVVGVLQVQSFTPGCYGMTHASMLGLAANVAAVAIENARLVNDLQRSNDELLQAYDSTLEGWSHALDLRDEETQGHSQRVTDLAVRLARAAGMSDEQVGYVRWGALLHDIGKMGVPDAVLLKPGKLDDEEWRLMRLHPVYAYNLLEPITFLRPALDIPHYHHEKWDGTGYPRGLRGEEIPLAARMFAVIDIWDALRSDRPYRPAWDEERVRAHIQGLSGSHLDPAVVDLFFRVIDEGS
ncbi:HD domain-containing protein [Chloroflexales bacterium ZM16-3]|nr:HD domain-containing protein [Chloroflexales bacterium ZM16-3]